MAESAEPSLLPLVALPVEAVDDLIYDARAGDRAALEADLAAWAQQLGCPVSHVVASAIDAEPQSEGGSGACLLHFPAANGNVDVLRFLLHIVSAPPSSAALMSPSQPQPTPLLPLEGQALVNHKNYSGNTPLHWAALNTHLECVKLLVDAGADVSLKNAAGHDAVFLAERGSAAAWDVAPDRPSGDRAADEEDTAMETDRPAAPTQAALSETGPGTATTSTPPASPAQQVVDFLLSCDGPADEDSREPCGP